MTSAVIIKDSINWLGDRLTTLVLTYHRFIHSEFMTHRVLSKNSASSRAIPTEKIIQDIRDNTAFPIWTKNQKGMQGEIIEDEELIEKLNADWIFSRNFMINEAGALSMVGVHKQNANRVLEPFQYMRVICTGTEWDNFFLLRNHKDAQPEIQELARCIKDAMDNCIPQYLNEGEWHIPFGDKMNSDKLYTISKNLDKKNKDNTYLSLKVSVARCARISYNTFEGEINYEKDLELYNRLVSSEPRHLSPTEHIARVPTESELEHFSSSYITSELGKYEYHKGKYISNLNGWIQYRKLIENQWH